MHHEVKGDWDPRYWCQANELSIAEKSSSTMVIAVEEGYTKIISWYEHGGYAAEMLTQWLLLQDQKDGVKQFEVFGEIVQLLRVSN